MLMFCQCNPQLSLNEIYNNNKERQRQRQRDREGSRQGEIETETAELADIKYGMSTPVLHVESLRYPFEYFCAHLHKYITRGNAIIWPTTYTLPTNYKYSC